MVSSATPVLYPHKRLLLPQLLLTQRVCSCLPWPRVTLPTYSISQSTQPSLKSGYCHNVTRRSIRALPECRLFSSDVAPFLRSLLSTRKPCQRGCSGQSELPHWVSAQLQCCECQLLRRATLRPNCC